MKNLKKYAPVLLVVALFLMMSGCVAGHNPAVYAASSDGNIAGFWLGLWHGMIAPITFILSLLDPMISFYEVHNNGGWYNLGFVMGAGILFGGSGSASRAVFLLTRKRKIKTAIKTARLCLPYFNNLCKFFGTARRRGYRE